MKASPQIAHLEWGAMNVVGVGRGRDMKLWPGGGREWDWGETGTHHVPGIQIADVEQLLQQGAEIVALTRGMELVLETCPTTLQHLTSLGIRFHVAATSEAAVLYNRLPDLCEPVGGLFHSTC